MRLRNRRAGLQPGPRRIPRSRRRSAGQQHPLPAAVLTEAGEPAPGLAPVLPGRLRDRSHRPLRRRHRRPVRYGIRASRNAGGIPARSAGRRLDRHDGHPDPRLVGDAHPLGEGAGRRQRRHSAPGARRSGRSLGPVHRAEGVPPRPAPALGGARLGLSDRTAPEAVRQAPERPGGTQGEQGRLQGHPGEPGRRHPGPGFRGPPAPG